MYTRREFGRMALAGLAVPRFLDAATSALVNGVRLGVQTYSFRDMPRTPGSDMVDPLIKAMLECELVECELWAPQLEPQFDSGARGRRGQPPPADAGKAREEPRRWRPATPPDHFPKL